MKWRKETGLVPARPAWRAPEASDYALALVEGGRIVPARVPAGRQATGYLRISAQILLEAERSGVRTIGVVSAVAGEGKTTAALNLAASLGRTRGREGRVLLVDGDARQRTLTRLLAGAGGERHTKPMLLATAFDGVDFLSAPDLGPGPTIHAPAAWSETLRALSERYPQVVIDCPAILSDPEGVVLRECVEALVFVVRAGRTTRKTLERAVNGSGHRVLGVIMNGAREGTPVYEGSTR